MKKVFLSLAFVAALTVVSCKQADANAEAGTEMDSTTVEAPVVENDSMAAPMDSSAVETPATEAPAAEAPKAE